MDMTTMVTFDEAAAMLDKIADELPPVFYKDLNGGVYLLPDTKMHNESRKNQPLYILGEYICRHDIGNLIYLYYGSLMKAYSHLPPDELKQALKRVLIHEFTHHLEFLAGDRGLEVKDDIEMERYRHS
jgi:predicted Zn-dependent protease with MMP-like domain